MDLANAAILRIDSPAPATAAGEMVLTEGQAIHVPCVLDEPTASQKWAMGAVIADATARLFVDAADLPVAIVRGARIVTQLDGESTSSTLQVIYVRHLVLMETDVFEVFLKAI